MAKAFIQESTLTDIADAIRSKNGSSDTYLPSQMASAIMSIPSGGNEPDYFWVEDASGSSNSLTIKKNNSALQDEVFEWSTDKQSWTEITVTNTTGTTIPIAANSKIYLRGDNVTLGTSSSNTTSILSSGYISIGGDITTLIEKHGNQLYLPEYCFRKLFNYNINITDASTLIIPAVRLDRYSCDSMFIGCNNMQQPPQFTGPFLYLVANSLNNFLTSCSNLQVMPVLPPILSGAGYSLSAFIQNCTSITETTEIDIRMSSIPNNMLTQFCQGCTAINKVIINTSTWNTSGSVNWLLNVSATGDFYNLGGATIPSGVDGIPSGWTEHNTI